MGAEPNESGDNAEDGISTQELINGMLIAAKRLRDGLTVSGAGQIHPHVLLWCGALALHTVLRYCALSHKHCCLHLNCTHALNRF
jgi:hypothetical protein